MNININTMNGKFHVENILSGSFKNEDNGISFECPDGKWFFPYFNLVCYQIVE